MVIGLMGISRLLKMAVMADDLDGVPEQDSWDNVPVKNKMPSRENHIAMLNNLHAMSVPRSLLSPFLSSKCIRQPIPKFHPPGVADNEADDLGENKAIYKNEK